MDYIKQKLSKVFCILFSLYDKDRVISVAGIHATVLSIMIGLSSAYVLHLNSQINALEQDALNLADDVNKIKFSPIWISLVLPGFKFVEKWESTDDQMWQWIAHLLPIPHKDLLTQELSTPPFNVYLKDFGLNETEIKLGLIVSVALRSPFPDRMVFEGKRPRGLQPSPYKVFENIKAIEFWVEDVTKKIRPIASGINWFGADMFLDGFNWSEEINLRDKLLNTGDSRADSKYLEKIKKIPEEFLNNVIEIYEISQSVKDKVDRIKRLKKLLPSKFTIYFFLIFACIAFILGVLIPIIRPTIPEFFIVWFPILFYSFFLIYLVFNVASNIR